MKKIILMAVFAIFATAAVSAQDMAQATETYNNGAMALQMGDNAAALEAFQQALTMGEACGEEGAELVANCKNYIPQLMLRIGKDMINDKKYDEALGQIEKAAAIAKEYGNAEIGTEAAELIPMINMQKANDLLNSKDYAGAAEAYKTIVAEDPTNGMAQLRLGMALGATGKVGEAEAAYLEASKNGQEKTAIKQLSNMFVKRAAANLKAKYNEAIADALKSNEYKENPTAMKVAGTAASSLKDSKNAIAYLEKYLELAPNAKDANMMHYTIAALAQGLGDKQKAIDNYSKITGDPKLGETAKAQLAVLQK